MTVIRVDAATLARFEGVTGEVILADENGKPVQRVVVPEGNRIEWVEPTEDELLAAEHDPSTYALDEVWEKIKRGEAL